MADAKAISCYLNGLTLRTINEVEKILRDLPKQGDNCELQFAKTYGNDIKRSTGDVIASKSMQIREIPKPLSLSPPLVEKADSVIMTKSKEVKKSTSSTKRHEVKEVHTTVMTSASAATTTCAKTPSKFQCKVLTDQVRVSPIVSCNGVILELDVEVTMPDSEGTKKKLKLEIECPDFVPTRMKIGNKWKKIV